MTDRIETIALEVASDSATFEAKDGKLIKNETVKKEFEYDSLLKQRELIAAQVAFEIAQAQARLDSHDALIAKAKEFNLDK